MFEGGATAVLSYWNQENEIKKIIQHGNTEEVAFEKCWKRFNKTGYLSDSVIGMDVQ